MRKRDSDFVCWVCDHPWVILLVAVLLLTAVLTRSLWWGTVFGAATPPAPVATPAGGTPGAPATQAATAAIPTSSAWQTFRDAQEGYAIDYPPDWRAGPQLSDAPGGAWVSVVLANGSEAPSAQVSAADETARLEITGFDRGGETQADWIFGKWQWISGEVGPVQLGAAPALQTRFSPQEDPERMVLITWVEHGSRSLALTGQARADDAGALATLERIVESLWFTE